MIGLGQELSGEHFLDWHTFHLQLVLSASHKSEERIRVAILAEKHVNPST